MVYAFLHAHQMQENGTCSVVSRVEVAELKLHAYAPAALLPAHQMLARRESIATRAMVGARFALLPAHQMLTRRRSIAARAMVGARFALLPAQRML